jgi:outer membrane protein OmpA-like peptidoglycan-associated protein
MVEKVHANFRRAARRDARHNQRRPLMKTLSKALVVAVLLPLGGCANMDQTQQDTARGAGIGAVAGAVLGGALGGSREDAAKGAAIGAVGGAIAGNVWSKKMQRQKQQMEQATAGTGVTVSQTADNRLKLEIPSDISFDVNRYAIKPEFRSVLDQFAVTLQDNPATNVTIIGHTDSTGSDAVNNPLSVNRAAATRDYLSSHGVRMSRMSIDGRGSREPIASNDTAEGRRMNRRVEIFVAEPQPAQ